MDEKKQVKNLPEETELQIENANIDINKEEGNVVELPATSGSWKDVDVATVNFEKKGWREVVLNIISGDADLNYFTIIAE